MGIEKKIILDWLYSGMYQNEFCVEKVKLKERETTQGFDLMFGVYLAAMLELIVELTGSPSPSIVSLRNEVFKNR